MITIAKNEVRDIKSIKVTGFHQEFKIHNFVIKNKGEYRQELHNFRSTREHHQRGRPSLMVFLWEGGRRRMCHTAGLFAWFVCFFAVWYASGLAIGVH